MTDGISPEFIAEAQEIVDALNASLIAAEAESREGEVEPGLINNLFRSAHSLKGISGMFGLEQMSSLAHALESVLDGMRLGRVALTPEAMDVLFACVECFNAMIQAAAQGELLEEAKLDHLLARLSAVAVGTPTTEATDPIRSSGLDEEVLAVLTEYEEHRLRENVRKGRGLYMLRTSFDLSNFDIGLAELDHALKGLGEVITKLPSSEGTSPDSISFDILVGSAESRESLVKAIGDDRVEVISLQRRSARGPRPPAEAQPPRSPPAPPPEVEGAERSEPPEEPEEPAAMETATAADEEPAIEELASLKSVAQTVRVDIRRLDRLMNLVGELGLIRLAFENATANLRRDDGMLGAAADMQKIARNFERRLSELQAGIMEVRMVPLSNLFERMVRIGRRMGRELGREVRIELSGKTTELDKLIVEELADSLMHIIRNAIDHGMEPPDERVAAGKPAEGVVKLSAAALGNHVVVQVNDDGRGIDPSRVLNVAVARGLVDAERASEMSQREIFNFLFMPGFSTRTDVSEFSGRGVGLDVVKTNITKLSGVIEVDSTKGQGTTFTLTLPITLAIIPALVVRVAREVYAIPLNNVLETIKVDKARVQTIERREILTVRGATVPLVDVRTLFGLEGARPERVYAVLIGAGETRMALVVDDLVGHQDIVIKSLGRHLRRVRGVAGATELGNQQTILVIDTVELINELTTGLQPRLTG